MDLVNVRYEWRVVYHNGNVESHTWAEDEADADRHLAELLKGRSIVGRKERQAITTITEPWEPM